jgi:hypothetical protein
MSEQLNELAEEMAEALEDHEAGEERMQDFVLPYLQRALDLAPAKVEESPVEASPLHHQLKDYAVEDFVEVLRAGAWVPGKVESIDLVSGHLHVGTERGPVTIANDHRVQKAV